MNGYCEALLLNIEQVAEGNAPGQKMHLSGFTKMLFCCQNSSASVLNDATPDSGHVRNLTVKFQRRPGESSIQDEDNCDVNRIPVYDEFGLPGWLYRQTSWFIPDNEIRKYCDDASDTVNVGDPATPMMTEHYNTYVQHANALLRSINEALVTRMATNFGENVTIGSADGKVINLPQDVTKQILNDGVVELLSDLRENEICEDICIVGNGLMANYELVNGDRMGLPTMFFDKATRAIWGENAFGAFTAGSVKFLGTNRYAGAFGGPKGDSIFTVVPFPYQEFNECADPDGCLRDLMFDMQLRYISCPQTIDLNGVPTAVGRGWQVILSKYFQLFVMPSNLYENDDELFGTNGTLLYFATNDANSPGAYAYA